MYRQLYEDALKMPLDEWRERLASEDQVLLSVIDTDTEEWAGILMVLSPRRLQFIGYGAPEGLLSGQEIKEERELWMLMSIWTRPSQRRRGVAGMLLDASVEFMRKKVPDGGLLALESKQFNESGLRVYRTAEFEERFKKIYPDEDPTVWMVRDLRTGRSD
jgi:ribosomal protein S18 acetylase RimI-like enzyme